MGLLRVLTALALAVCAGGLGLSPASAVPPDYVPLQESGVVTKIADGDTIYVLPDGGSTIVKVRLLGVNAPEVAGFKNLHFDHDFCGGPEATRLTASLLPIGTRVELRSLDKASSNRGRLLRYVYGQNPRTGLFDVDVAAALATAGLANWFTVDGESTHSYDYRLLIDEAQRAGRGIWDPSYCGPVEQPDARPKLTIVWNAPGADAVNLNGEYVVLRNNGLAPLDLSGWLLRDSSLTGWYFFPEGTVLVPGDFLVAHTGCGINGQPTARDYYLCANAPLFPNTSETEFLGDEALLLDGNTAIRAFDIYPCSTDCTDPLTGKLVISKVNARSTSPRPSIAANQEYVDVTNVSTETLALDGYYLRRKVSSYPFLAGTVLAPGERVRVRIGKGAQSVHRQFWGQERPLLTNKHDKVQLLSNKDVVISTVAW